MNELKLLFATDFSPGSQIAVAVLKQLQQKFSTDIFLIHVVASFWKDWLASGSYKKEALQRLQTWQLKLQDNVDLKKLHVKFGNCADEILAEADLLSTNLIILGAKNSQGGGRYKSGNTVESVVRNAKQSVLVCKKDNLKKILCCIDGSAHSSETLAQAIEFARSFNAQLTILSVIPQIDTDVLGMDEKAIAAEESRFEQETVANINTFLQKFDLSGIDVAKQFKWGVPSHVILDTAEDLQQDLIVIGAKGHGMLQYVLMGSTAEKVLHFTPCSLLVVR